MSMWHITLNRVAAGEHAEVTITPAASVALPLQLVHAAVSDWLTGIIGCQAFEGCNLDEEPQSICGLNVSSILCQCVVCPEIALSSQESEMLRRSNEATGVAFLLRSAYHVHEHSKIHLL